MARSGHEPIEGRCIILYFSATGNSKHVAQRLCAASGDHMRSITELEGDPAPSFSGEVVGIVSPTYYWGLPSNVDRFLKSAHIEAGYLFFVATYGMTPGAIWHVAQKALGSTRIDAFYSVRMPDTWTPVFDLSTPEAVAAFTGTTEDEIDAAISHIASRDHGNFMDRRAPAAGALAWRIAYPRARRTSHFHVEESCIGCGLCARRCPAHAIEIVDGRPVWTKKECILCLGCLHRCPKFAIQYGPHTKEHGQYLNPHVKP